MRNTPARRSTHNGRRRPTIWPTYARCSAAVVALAALAVATAGCGGGSTAVAARSAASSAAAASPTPTTTPTTAPGLDPTSAVLPPPTPPSSVAGAVPPAPGSCALTVTTATAILGAQAEDEGWGEQHCVFSPTTEPGYGQPTYYSVGEDTYPNQSVTAFRAGQAADGDVCPRHLERPDLGAGAYEAYCFVADFVGGGQKAMLVLPDARGSWQLVVELHKARVTSDSTAADLLHKAMAALHVG